MDSQEDHRVAKALATYNFIHSKGREQPPREDAYLKLPARYYAGDEASTAKEEATGYAKAEEFRMSFVRTSTAVHVTIVKDDEEQHYRSPSPQPLLHPDASQIGQRHSYTLTSHADQPGTGPDSLTEFLAGTCLSPGSSKPSPLSRASSRKGLLTYSIEGDSASGAQEEVHPNSCEGASSHRPSHRSGEASSTAGLFAKLHSLSHLSDDRPPASGTSSSVSPTKKLLSFANRHTEGLEPDASMSERAGSPSPSSRGTSPHGRSSPLQRSLSQRSCLKDASRCPAMRLSEGHLQPGSPSSSLSSPGAASSQLPGPTQRHRSQGQLDLNLDGESAGGGGQSTCMPLVQRQLSVARLQRKQSRGRLHLDEAEQGVAGHVGDASHMQHRPSVEFQVDQPSRNALRFSSPARAHMDVDSGRGSTDGCVGNQRLLLRLLSSRSKHLPVGDAAHAVGMPAAGHDSMAQHEGVAGPVPEQGVGLHGDADALRARIQRSLSLARDASRAGRLETQGDGV